LSVSHPDLALTFFPLSYLKKPEREDGSRDSQVPVPLSLGRSLYLRSRAVLLRLGTCPLVAQLASPSLSPERSLLSSLELTPSVPLSLIAIIGPFLQRLSSPNDSRPYEVLTPPLHPFSPQKHHSFSVFGHMERDQTAPVLALILGGTLSSTFILDFWTYLFCIAESSLPDPATFSMDVLASQEPDLVSPWRAPLPLHFSQSATFCHKVGCLLSRCYSTGALRQIFPSYFN